MSKHRVDPYFEKEVDRVEGMFGKGYYAARWKSMFWPQKLWYTIRGYNPGGRKGAPPLS
jgi:hypothetical protein